MNPLYCAIFSIYLFLTLEKIRVYPYLFLHFNVNTKNVNYQMEWSGQYIVPYLVHEKIYKNYLNISSKYTVNRERN